MSRTDASARVGRAAAIGLAALAFGAAGCRTEMYDQPRYETFERSRIFRDGLSARPLVAGTVPRGWSMTDEHFYYGRVDGKLAEEFPVEVDAEMLNRGKQRYEIYCIPCHGKVGAGDGMIVRRGFSPPPTFHSDRLRTMPVGHYYDVITRGYGAMYSYAARVKPEDRWAITAYIRALQLSQNVPVAELTAEERARLQEGTR